VQVAQRATPLPATEQKASARELAGDFGFQVQRFLQEQLRDFREADRYFKLKVLIVGLWLLASAASLAVAFRSTGADGPEENPLGAYVRKTKASLGWTVLVHNQSDEPWSACILTLNDGFVLEKAIVPVGEKLVLGMSQFQKSGQPPPPSEEPRRLQLRCREGSVEPVMQQ